MTNLEALNSVIGGNYPFDPNVFEKALKDQNVVDTDLYSSINEKAIDYAVMNVILTVILRPSIEQGGYKVSDTDKNALISVRNSLLNKYGLPLDMIQIPKINKVRVW